LTVDGIARSFPRRIFAVVLRQKLHQFSDHADTVSIVRRDEVQERRRRPWPGFR